MSFLDRNGETLNLGNRYAVQRSYRSLTLLMLPQCVSGVELYCGCAARCVLTRMGCSALVSEINPGASLGPFHLRLGCPAALLLYVGYPPWKARGRGRRRMNRRVAGLRDLPAPPLAVSVGCVLHYQVMAAEWGALTWLCRGEPGRAGLRRAGATRVEL